MFSLNIDKYLNIPTIISFAMGILMGFLLLLLVYILAVIKGMNKEVKRRKIQESDVDLNEINWLIDESKMRYKNLEKEKKQSSFKNLYEVGTDLSHNIASKFYPRSKKPLQELTVDEILILTHYISDRIDDLLSARILKMFRGMTIKQILDLKNTGQKITESKIYKSATGAKLGKMWQAVKIVNPFYWIKKGTINQAIKIIIKKIALNSIVIIGEETYKIYSKKIFETPVDEELTFDELEEIIQIEEEEDNVKKKKRT
ncbi:MAG: hypothetical protein ACOX56_02495 [Acholeplasmataceae bacterium]|jgi:hypothetical protein